MTNIIYFLFSSITFLQFYIPLVLIAKKNNYESVFILRKNAKGYANPFEKSNFSILDKYLKKYNIKSKSADEVKIEEIQGIVFMMDGDIYGPPRKNAIEDSLLFKLNYDNTIRISMTEHMNFWAVYHHFINHINYASFSNKSIIDQMKNFNNKVNLFDISIDTNKSYHSKKNIFLGNTKFDNIPKKSILYKKYKLNQNERYCLFLYPKKRDFFGPKELLKIYDFLRKLGFKIIVKSRPKDEIIPKNLRGDYFVCSDIYPNESIELMKISQLCLISSSSANEETIMMGIPCIDIQSDLRNYERNNFLSDNKTCIQIKNKRWRNITFKEFRNIYKKLEKKNSKYFNKIKKKYLFTWDNSSERIFNFAIDKLKKLEEKLNLIKTEIKKENKCTIIIDEKNN